MNTAKATRLGNAASGAVLALLLAFFTGLSGCDSGGGGASPSPVLEVVLSSHAVQATRTVTATAVLLDRQDDPQVTWAVDGVVGGSDSTGLITQDNPATYTAPAVVPPARVAIIEARLVSEPWITGQDTLSVLFTILYVDQLTGDDESGQGTWVSRFETVTRALSVATRGDTVFVFPGTYEGDHGVPAGVAVRGAERDSCVLVGTGDGAAVVMRDSSVIERLTVAGGGMAGVELSLAARVRDVTVGGDFWTAGVLDAGDNGDTLVEDCEVAGGGPQAEQDPRGAGVDLRNGSRATIRGCLVRGWEHGIMVIGDSDPLIEACEISGNTHGVGTGETNDAETRPDLGGGDRGSLGNNLIRGNAICGLANRTPGAIYAVNNTWNVQPVDPPVYCLSEGDGCDICATNGGLVYWCNCGPP